MALLMAASGLRSSWPTTAKNSSLWRSASRSARLTLGALCDDGDLLSQLLGQTVFCLCAAVSRRLAIAGREPPSVRSSGPQLVGRCTPGMAVLRHRWRDRKVRGLGERFQPLAARSAGPSRPACEAAGRSTTAGAGNGTVPFRPGLGPGTCDSIKDTSPSYFLVRLSDIHSSDHFRETWFGHGLVPFKLARRFSTHAMTTSRTRSFVRGGRVLVCGGRVLLGVPAVPVRGFGVLLGRLVLAHLEVVGRLQVVMRGGRVVGGGLVMARDRPGAC